MDATLNTFREIRASAQEIFAAFSDPKRLAKWWGPAGFTNTFNVCEFKSGGQWSYVMHGPDGKNYPNESVFAQIEAPKKVVIEHISLPKYRLTIALNQSEAGTVVSWAQEFENTKFAESRKELLTTANEQNLDRLTAEVTEGK